jgi:hypothetical protein
MSGLLITSRAEWEVPWANELILLKPAHPKGLDGGKTCSHVTSFVTVFFGGSKSSSLSGADVDWEVGIVHRGALDERSIVGSLDFCNRSLSYAKDDQPKYLFLNQILSEIPDKRRIVAASGGKPRVHLYVDEVVSPELLCDVYPLDKAKVRVDYLQAIDCTIIAVRGKGNRPCVFRISYDHAIPVQPIDTNTAATYTSESLPNVQFPVEQDFVLFSYHRVLDALRSQINGNDEASEVFRDKIEGRLVTQRIQSLDLAVIGDPSAFRYEFLNSHLSTVDTHVRGVRWVSLNGADANGTRAIAYLVFPKKEFHRAPEPFEMHVRARLACNVCNQYIFGRIIEAAEHRMQGLTERLHDLEQLIRDQKTETEQTVASFLQEFKQLETKFGKDKGTGIRK